VALYVACFSYVLLVMFLEKLEIQGFKSFASKNILTFPGMVSKEKKGITAVVGPNGSGKSNIADAIRWVLGEQSMKMLRGKKSEDVIFSGSEKASKLGMAEVSLFLNNEAGKAPIDYSQIVLTRRLYRDSTSEYLLNNSRVRLTDIEMLLAKSSFGQKTYSVIGQGTVESFLNTSLAERKEFFDEATGVKQFQLKRDDALNKLINSYENLTQAEMILTEIEPRLRSLTRQVNRLKKRSEIEEELKEINLVYYGQIWHEVNSKFSEFNNKYLEIEKIKLEKDRKLENFIKKLKQLERENEITGEFDGQQKELADWQEEKNKIIKEISKLEAEAEVKLEAGGQFDLSWLNQKRAELKREKEKIEKEIGELEKNADKEKSEMLKFENEIRLLADKIKKLNEKLVNSRSALEGAKKISWHLSGLLAKLGECEEENGIEKIKALIKEIREDLKKIMALAKNEDEKNSSAKIQEEIIKLTIEKEEIAKKNNAANLKIAAQNERLKLLKEKKESVSSELTQIEYKFKKYENGPNKSNAGGAQEKLREDLRNIEDKIKLVRAKIDNFSRQMEEKRTLFFELQRNVQDLQNEINSLNNELSELKVGAARHETKLEDLEAEIREFLGGIKEVREKKPEVKINIEEVKEKIVNLKKQLDLIGGIDPEIEKEFKEAKERFDFLSGQLSDLKKAIDSLEKIIKELDIIIKERFDKEFKLISEKFQEYFKILFNGGSAKIMKVLINEEGERDDEKKDKNGQGNEQKMEDMAAENKKIETGQADNIKRIKYLQKYNATGLAGVEIQATPPGKKIKSITMLSGGERAMTAIALICAIISANPSPFVVLDEVDAALDEANSERLAKILDDLSYKTQFIVITHNRASMHRANILYGVTMQEDGISKLLSVKLEEAVKK